MRSVVLFSPVISCCIRSVQNGSSSVVISIVIGFTKVALCVESERKISRETDKLFI